MLDSTATTAGPGPNTAWTDGWRAAWHRPNTN